VKEKVIVHTSRDIRAIANQLVKLWVETFRREKAAGALSKSLHQSSGLKSAQKMAKPKAGPKSETEAKDRTSASTIALGHPNSGKENSLLASIAESDTTDQAKKDCVTGYSDLVIPISDSEAAALAAAEAAQAAAEAAVKVRIVSPLIDSLCLQMIQHTDGSIYLCMNAAARLSFLCKLLH
jgi:hypothetical protein